MPMLLAAGMATTSCSTMQRINVIPTYKEIEIGAETSKEIESKIKIYRDTLVVNYIKDLGKEIASHSPRQNVRYQFKVVDTPTINAFAVPGGWLYVNLGLIALTESESELAGVIGHEIAHVAKKHGARQMTTFYGLSFMFELVQNLQIKARSIVSWFLNVGGTMTLLKYSRDMETEADKVGVNMVHKTGIDPNGMIGFFEKMKAKQAKNPGWAENLLSTHPTTTSRISSVNEEVKKFKAIKIKHNTPRYDKVRKHVRKYLEFDKAPAKSKKKGKIITAINPTVRIK
jgi:predicted Zn-dependent protease